MTAFAPYTTGVPLRINKDMEVMKQYYDISTLIDEFNDFPCVYVTYYSISEVEINYRDMNITPSDALMDTIRAAMCIGSRGKIQPDDFPSYVRGSRDVLQHIYVSGFSMEQAVKFAPKLLYLAACLLTKTPFIRISDGTVYRNEELHDEALKKLKFFRKADSIGYGYLIQTDRLLQQFKS